MIRVQVLPAPAAKQLAPIRRTLEHFLEQRRRDELPLAHRRDIHLVDHAQLIAL